MVILNVSLGHATQSGHRPQTSPEERISLANLTDQHSGGNSLGKLGHCRMTFQPGNASEEFPKPLYRDRIGVKGRELPGLLKDPRDRVMMTRSDLHNGNLHFSCFGTDRNHHT